MSDAAPEGEATTTTEDGGDATAEVTDWQAEAEKWKALADQTEKRAKRYADEAKAGKAAAAELEATKLAAMSDTEKAVEIARTQARAEALAEVGGELVDLAVRAAAGDRNVDVDALLEGLDRTRFLTEDGKADTTAIQAWVDRIAPKPEGPAGFPDLGQGARDNGAMALNGDPLLRSVMSKLKS